MTITSQDELEGLKAIGDSIEPFLSMGGGFAAESGDGWTLLADPLAPTVQYEHSLVATKNGPVILALV